MVDIVTILKRPQCLTKLFEEIFGSLDIDNPVISERITRLSDHVNPYKNDLFGNVACTIGRRHPQPPGWYHFFLTTDVGAKIDFRCIYVLFIPVLSRPEQAIVDCTLIKKELDWTHCVILFGVNDTTESRHELNLLYQHFNVRFVPITNVA